MELEEAKERLKRFDGKCDKCKFATCEQCEINYSDVQAINIVLAELDRQKEIKAEMRKVAFEEGFEQGRIKGIMEAAKEA